MTERIPEQVIEGTWDKLTERAGGQAPRRVALNPITEEVIREAVDILVRVANPTRVIVFGSHARGDAGPDSDLDILVVERDEPDKLAEMNRLAAALRPLFIPVDVLVASEAYVASSWAD